MVYSEKFYVGFSDVGMGLGITNTAILKLFENVCCMQGEHVGDSYCGSVCHWFVTAYSVKVFKRPSYNDFVIANTWSRGMKGVYASREFEIRSESGELLAAALSNWVRMNTKLQKLEKMPPEEFEKYQSEAEHTNFGEMWLPKIAPAAETLYESELKIDRSMIDANRHVNNVRYLELAARALPESDDFSEADAFEIAYRKAIAYGENVKCLYGRDGNGRCIAVKSEDIRETRAIIRLY